MKLSIDPMPALRDHAAYKMNQYFNTLASDNLHRDQAHANKRAQAAAVAAGEMPSAEFQAEAELRCISAAELAQEILLKPNDMAQRELNRQKLMLRIAKITLPSELAELTSNINRAIGLD